MEIPGILKPSLILLKKVLEIPENLSRKIEQPNRILIICPHFSLTELIASTPLFRAIKEKYPGTHITLLIRNSNKDAVINNPYIDSLLYMHWQNLFLHLHFGLIYEIRRKYEIAIVPVIESLSFISSLLARLSNSMIRIGAASINGKENPYSFCFDRRINLDWKKYHDTHITEKILELVRPFGIETKDMRLQIDFTDEDIKSAVGFISKFECEKETLIIGLSLDSINSSSLWSLDNFASLIERINSRFKANFYIIENIDEKKLTGIVLSKLSFEIFTFNDRNVSKMAALIAQTDLFITNNSRIMHIAGSTGTPMIVIFGQTNPYSILPFGENKYFLRKSDLIDDVTVDDAFSLCCKVLESNKKLKQNLT